MSDQAKVVYVLPLYDEETDSHLFYNYDLIRNAAVKMDIFVIVENAHGGVNLNAPFVILKKKKGIGKLIEIYSILRKKKKEGYESAYVHYSLYGSLAALMAGSRLYYWNRGMPWLFKRSFWHERIFRFILKRSILVTGPESLALEYEKHYGVRRYKILSNWIDVSRFFPREDKALTKKWFALEPDAKIVLFVHHLSERKGADLISKIAEKFVGTNVIFFVLGDGPYKRQLEIQAQTLPIRVFGPVPNKNIMGYFQAADVFLMPSREEGSPHVILDTMASGTPFVASDVGGTRELLPPHFDEFLCDPEDVECFRQKINILLTDSSRYESLRQEGLEFVKKYDRDLGVNEFVNLFQ